MANAPRFTIAQAAPDTRCHRCGADLSGRAAVMVNRGAWRPQCPRCVRPLTVAVPSGDPAVIARRAGACWPGGDLVQAGQVISARDRVWGHPACWEALTP
jgi:hypothetical protein